MTQSGHPLMSMSAEHQRLERKHQRLEPQNYGVHESKRIHSMEERQHGRCRCPLPTIMSWLFE